MDRLIKRFDATPDEDLMLCTHRGVAHQRNMDRDRIEYGQDYFDHYRALAGSPIARALNAGRCAMLARYASDGARVIDIGIGSGEFIETAMTAGFMLKGFDINPVAVEWLNVRGLYDEDTRSFDVLTAWDSIEHMPDPEVLLKRIHVGARLIVAVPLVEDLSKIRESKHYKPGEHLYYWTEPGFIEWMSLYGFRLIERSDHEVSAGRESIGAFAFKRDLPDYHEHIEAYREMHREKHYGDSASELYLPLATSIVRARKPGSILDYGCGRSDLAVHFYLDGRRKLVRYDPAIARFSTMPEEKFDLVFCCDVMEHIPTASVDRVLQELRSLGRLVLLTISLKLAKARLPDGRNAHVTLLTKNEWVRWVRDALGSAEVIPSGSEQELILLAGPDALDTKRRMH